MPVQVLSAVSQVSFIEYSSPMPLVQKVLVCISWFYLSRDLWPLYPIQGSSLPFSRLIASRLALQEKKEARFSLVTGTLMAVFFSAAAGFLLFQHAYFFASTILKTPQTASLLRITAVSIPLCAIHSCIDSYYYARKKSLCSGSRAAFGAGCPDRHYLYPVSDLSFRRTSDHCIDRSGWFSCRRGCRFAGVSAGSFLSFRKSPCTRKKSHQDLFAVKGPFHTVFPISLNRILLTLLGSIEAVLIPQMLLRSGMTASDSLKIYGIFTGMALPLLLFPSTLTSSAAVMMMPSIAQLDALGEQKQIRRVTDQTFFLCMFLGFLCGSGFFLFGPFLGTLLFHSQTAGTYIRYLSFICPFLYTNTMLTSILQGLGKPGLCLIHSIAGILIRIFSVVFIIPATGIRGYFYGIFLGELLLTLLHVKALKFSYRQSANNRL